MMPPRTPPKQRGEGGLGKRSRLHGRTRDAKKTKPAAGGEHHAARAAAAAARARALERWNVVDEDDQGDLEDE